MPATRPALNAQMHLPSKLDVATRVGLLGLTALFLAACQQADFAADLTNKTPQPVYAQLFTRSNDRTGSVLTAQTRLGPGDRGFLGPVRTVDRNGQVYLVVDPKPNPSNPVTLDLTPGTVFLEVHQEGDQTAGRLRLDRKP